MGDFELKKLYVSMYHYTRDLKHSRYPAIKGMEYFAFEKQLRFFKENFNVITMEQFMDAIDGGVFLPDHALLLTFDDGYIDHFTVALPLLKKYGMQGSFFIPGKPLAENVLLDVNKIHFVLASAPMEVIKEDLFALLDKYRSEGGYPSNEELWEIYSVTTRLYSHDEVFIKQILQTAIPEHIRGFISSELFDKYVGTPEDCFSRELYMNRDQIRFMKDSGMYIGAHSYGHDWLGNLPKEQMIQDFECAMDVMEEFIDWNRWVMNYPYGSFNDDVIEYISEHGCIAGFDTEVRVIDLEKDDKYKLPRLDCIDFPPRSKNYLTL